MTVVVRRRKAATEAPSQPAVMKAAFRCPHCKADQVTLVKGRRGVPSYTRVLTRSKHIRVYEDGRVALACHACHQEYPIPLSLHPDLTADGGDP